MAADVARYRADVHGGTILYPLDSLTAIYHRASGQTHLMASPAPEILELLGREAMTAEALLARLAEHFDLADPDMGALVARLDELVAAGLVEAL